MSHENKKPEEKSEQEVQQELEDQLETAQDEVFGTPVEIAAQAAEEAGSQTPEETEAQIKAEQEEKDAAALAKENEGKTPEELEAAEKKVAEDKEKAAAEALAKENEGKTPEELEAAAKAKEEEERYKIPEGLKERTRERFEKLTENLKGAHSTVEQQRGIIEGFQAVIKESGLNPTEMQRTLDLGSLIKTNPSKALPLLNSLVADLAAELGEVVPGANPLEGFDDLKEKVANREYSIEDATSIAQARIKTAAETKAADRQTEQGEQQALETKGEEDQNKAFAARVVEAQTSVGEFLTTVQKDPDADRIAPYLITAAKFAAENLAPERWMGYIKEEHGKVKQIASAMGASDKGGQPLMDGAAPPGGDKEPTNLTELADNML